MQIAPTLSKLPPRAPRNRIDVVKAQVHSRIDELLNGDGAHDPHIFFIKTLALREYLLSPLLDPGELRLYRKDPTVISYMSRFQSAFMSNEALLERQTSDSLHANSETNGLRTMFRDYYVQIYRLLANTEISLSGMNPASNVLMVGAGGLPLSALIMQAQSGARVLGLDREGDAIRAGTCFIDDLCTQHPSRYRRTRIALVHGDAEAHDYRGFDIVILSLHVKNKADVVKRIYATMSHSRPVTIIDRQVHGLCEYFYPRIAFDSSGTPFKKSGSMFASLVRSTAYRSEEIAGAGPAPS